jgi:hypothetical protein
MRLISSYVKMKQAQSLRNGLLLASLHKKVLAASIKPLFLLQRLSNFTLQFQMVSFRTVL